MKEIGSFFDKFKSSAVKEIGKRMAIAKILKKEIGEEIPMEHISVAEGILKIKTSSAIKSQIFIKKNSILKALGANPKEFFIKDIK